MGANVSLEKKPKEQQQHEESTIQYMNLFRPFKHTINYRSRSHEQQRTNSAPNHRYNDRLDHSFV